jgi:hypothetical protein
VLDRECVYTTSVALMAIFALIQENYRHFPPESFSRSPFKFLEQPFEKDGKLVVRAADGGEEWKVRLVPEPLCLSSGCQDGDAPHARVPGHGCKGVRADGAEEHV